MDTPGLIPPQQDRLTQLLKESIKLELMKQALENDIKKVAARLEMIHALKRKHEVHETTHLFI